MMIAGYPKWSGIHFPGMKPRPDGSGRTDPRSLVWHPDSDWQMPTNIQPIFKLHGSTNWQAADGQHMLVMGGNKTSAIWRNSVLRRYIEEFKSRLSEPGARLKVIGYGFRDRHINETIAVATQKSQSGVFLVGSGGRRTIRKANPTDTKPIFCPEPIDAVPIIGDSSRLLSTTFGGNDPAEHAKLLRFFG
jgi:hypothetical protein